MELALYGGAFDPPHNAHEKIVNYCYEKYDLIVLMPSGKTVGKEFDVSIRHRLKMLDIISMGYDNKLIIDNYEIGNKSYSYTINTIRYLEKKYNNYRINMIIGSDQLLNFSSWKDNREIIKKVNIVCINRPNSDVDIEVDSVRYIDEINLDISSSLIKKQLQSKLSLDSSKINPKILNYIHKNKLYNS